MCDRDQDALSGTPKGSTMTSMSTSLEKTSIPSASQEALVSVFGDSNCGEPLLAQHLVLDFTPSATEDNDFVQRKCCAFWDYISSRTDLHSMMVVPEAGTSKTTSLIDNPDETIADSFPDKKTAKKAKTAVSMLEFVEEKGLINRIFEAKMKQSHCTLGSREYIENTSMPNKPNQKEKIICDCKTTCQFCRNVPKRGLDPKDGRQSSPAVKTLCKQLQEWDKDHPKSMNPPGHPPPLSHSVMQRKVIM